MSDTGNLAERLSAALGRISAAAEGLDRPDPRSAEEASALAAELEAERTANQQLEERVRAIKERQESLVARLEAEVADLKAALVSRDGAVQHVRQTNGKLRQANRALRAANAQGLSDPDLVNAGLEAELEAVMALQLADRAELDDILAALEPFVGEAANA